ncbi:Diphthamide biosynthesis protein 2 [Saitozyma podzolica]|uniref:2-(3-amino-3-carboxypropyl)histidine synthase subunit 2 n=1 Tax=Saitozyma podzolica TaxID=1890683 RepID=A0A427YLP4_9TREE|nr:Diphthamide biosynthesis protein 2 [Saitozyma podzolica]
MSDAMSTPAAHAFAHPELSSVSAEAGPSSMGDASADLSVEEAFEVEDTIARIIAGGYKTIGLQFPDELLPSSVPVFRAIQKGIAHTGAQAYVLADSTYGSCCPDVLSCLHLPADFLVHYGHACLTPTDALPVHYVFPRKRIDVTHAALSLVEASADEMAGPNDIIETFSSACPWPVSFATIRRPPASSSASTSAPPAAPSERAQEKAPALRSVEPPEGLIMEECAVWYLGEEGRALLNLQMANGLSPIFAYFPSSRSASHLQTTSRLLQRRLLSIHSAVASDVFGLVVHSVGLKSSKPLLDELRRILKKERKKSYTLTVGRINPAKLANFEGIECFVLVGCNEGGLVDSKEFLRPIITPWELLLALQGPEHSWEPGKWTLDMSKVLQEAQAQYPTDAGAEAGAGANARKPANGIGAVSNDSESEVDPDAPVFSLVSGAYKSRRTFHDPSATPDSVPVPVEGIKDLTLRNQTFTLAKIESAGSTYLSSRSFQGLEPRYGMDEPAELEQGRGGIARGYTEEK